MLKIPFAVPVVVRVTRTDLDDSDVKAGTVLESVAGPLDDGGPIMVRYWPDGDWPDGPDSDRDWWTQEEWDRHTAGGVVLGPEELKLELWAALGEPHGPVKLGDREILRGVYAQCVDAAVGRELDPPPEYAAERVVARLVWLEGRVKELEAQVGPADVARLTRIAQAELSRHGISAAEPAPTPPRPKGSLAGMTWEDCLGPVHPDMMPRCRSTPELGPDPAIVAADRLARQPYHSFRRTMSTHLRSQGHYREAELLLGHSSGMSTGDTEYTDTAPGSAMWPRLVKAVETIPKVGKGKVREMRRSEGA